MDGVAMYGALAEREKNPERRTIFQKLGEFERRHAEQWARRLQALNASVPAAHDGTGHATRLGRQRPDVADAHRPDVQLQPSLKSPFPDRKAGAFSPSG